MRPTSLQFTKEKYESFLKEREDLQKKRVYTIAELQRARAMGDLSENGLYKAARWELSNIDRRLRQLKGFILKGIVIQMKDSSSVQLGSTVQLKTDATTQIYQIVGKFEANPQEGKISDESPLGGSLMGKKLHDTVRVHTPKNEIEYTIVGIT